MVVGMHVFLHSPPISHFYSIGRHFAKADISSGMRHCSDIDLHFAFNKLYASD